jgi:hypothetical protein
MSSSPWNSSKGMMEISAGNLDYPVKAASG